MGSGISFITGHGKRLINRYNAQYRAHVFLDKEKLPSAPRHTTATPDLSKPESLSDDYHAKNLKLDEYLRDVYVKDSEEQIIVDSSGMDTSKRPYPKNRESVVAKDFKEPEVTEAGFCTLSQVIEFLTGHETDPVLNTASAIAKNYNLDEKKVEAVLLYHTIFRVYDPVVDTLPKMEELPNPGEVPIHVDALLGDRKPREIPFNETYIGRFLDFEAIEKLDKKDEEEKQRTQQ